MLKNKLFFWDMSLPKAIAAVALGAIIGSSLTIAIISLLEYLFWGA